ncbi:MAG: polyamine ABC transporter substrate-binding protein [Bauldia sp.]|nr:polyamine ABC transporter substrate-binding protein [Bauldia sp.]
MLATAVSILACLPLAAQQAEVRVYNWSDYIDPKLLTQFEEETGIKVVYDELESNQILETKMLAGNSGYDVVVPSDSYLQRQIAAGVYRPLDKALLPNIGNLWDAVTRQTDAFDPGGVYSINYMWGTTGIGYDRDAVKARLGTDTVDSWGVIFDPDQIAKLADCGVYLLDTPGAVFPAAMAYLGLDPASTHPDDWQRAADLVMSIRPYVAKFDSSGYVDALASGDACLVIGWSGDVLQARDSAAKAVNGKHIAYVIPKEGAQMWFDQMAIPRDAPNPEAAHRFLDFILRPDVIAAASNYVHYANGNKASQALLDPDILDDPAIYPPPDVMERLFVVPTSDTNITRLITRMWTRIKTGA